MEILNSIDKNEIIQENMQYSSKTAVKNSIMANLIYVVLWVAFDAFFVYVMTLKTVKEEFWLVLIPVCGFNLLIIWTYIFKVLKEYTEKKESGYVLTDKAIYSYSNGKYKQLNRIALEDIVVVEKSEFIYDGFYVASLNTNIHITNIKEERELFDILIKYVKNS